MPSAIFISPFTPQASGGTPAATLNLYAYPSASLAAATTVVDTVAPTYDETQEWYQGTIDTTLGVFRGVVRDDNTSEILSEYLYYHNGDALVYGSDNVYLADMIDDLAISTGNGARTVTVTVNDGTDPLENATVRMTSGAETRVGDTDVSGNVTFNLDDATWTVAITKANYTFAGASLVVDGDETPTYSMSIVTPLTAGTGSFTTGFLTAYDEAGVVEAGATISSQLISLASGDTGFSYDAKVRTAVSDVNGLVQITGMVKGATYRLWRGSRAIGSTDNLVAIPAAAGTTYELPSFVGTECIAL